MSIGFDKILGPHADALALRSARAQVLANNLANVDTPNYKARDINFEAALNNATQGQRINLRRVNEGHVDYHSDRWIGDRGYRVPNQPSVDGNTVDGDMEMTTFAENQLNFQASFTIVEGRFRGILGALRGE